MKKFTTAIAALTIAFGPSLELAAKADKSCWSGSIQQWPDANFFGWSPLMPSTIHASDGGAAALITYAAYTVGTVLTKTSTSINGVPTATYKTNQVSRGLLGDNLMVRIQLPEPVLCNFPNNFAKVEAWLYYAPQVVGSADFSAYASAKIQGN